MEPNGNTLANSQIRDDGTRVTIGSFAFNDPNSVNIYPTSVTTPNASLQVGSVGEIFGMYTDDATGRLHFTANNPSIVAGNEIMVLDDDGIRGVGIGAATAMGKLHVSGTHNNTYAVPTTFASATSAIVEQNSTTAVLVSGVQAYANGGGTENYGVFGVSGGSAGANYGGLFLAQAASTGTNIGIFARASAGATNRAAFFQGTVQIVDGTQGAGKVLLSDASGTASWQNKNIGITLQLLNGTQTVMPSGVTIPITSWSTVVSEEGGANYAPGTGEYTITRAGVYNVEANIFWLGFTAPSTINVFSVELNGVPTAAQTTDPAIAGQILNNKIALARRYAVGDKIRISFQQNSGAPQTLFVGASANHFSVQFIHD